MPHPPGEGRLVMLCLRYRRGGGKSTKAGPYVSSQLSPFIIRNIVEKR